MSNGSYSKGKTGAGSSLGMVLIGVGGLLALSNMGIIGGFGGVVGLLVLAGLGAWLLNQYYTGRRQLWLLLGGFILLGCGAATVTGVNAGAWFLAISGLGFLTAWREDDSRWWAVIPAGTMFTLAAVVVADNSWRWIDGGAVFFLGMAATFMALHVLPRHAQSWALIPAAACGALALVAWGSSGSWLLPVVLIGVGLYLVRGNGKVTVRFDTGGRGQTRPPARSEPARESAADSAAEPATPLLPERIDSTGPELGDNWPGQGGAR